jgi:hypothetical protein
MPGNSPVPTSLVSLITLTRMGDVGDVTGPLPNLAPEAHDVPSADAPAVVAGAPAASNVPEAVRGLGETLRRLVAWWARPAAAEDVAAPGTAVTAERPQVAASGSPVLAAASPMAGEAGGTTQETGSAAAVVKSLATASGPWLLVAGVLGAATVYARRWRLARRKAARHADANLPPVPRPGLFGSLGLRARSRPPHARHPASRPLSMPSRPNAVARPRHLNNP